MVFISILMFEILYLWKPNWEPLALVAKALTKENFFRLSYMQLEITCPVEITGRKSPSSQHVLVTDTYFNISSFLCFSWHYLGFDLIIQRILLIFLGVVVLQVLQSNRSQTEPSVITLNLTKLIYHIWSTKPYSNQTSNFQTKYKTNRHP